MAFAREQMKLFLRQPLLEPAHVMRGGVHILAAVPEIDLLVDIFYRKAPIFDVQRSFVGCAPRTAAAGLYKRDGHKARKEIFVLRDQIIIDASHASLLG